MGLDIWAISNCIEARDSRMSALRRVEEIGVGQLEEILDLDKVSAKGWHGLKPGTWFRTPGSVETRARLGSYSYWSRWCHRTAEILAEAGLTDTGYITKLLNHNSSGGGFGAAACNGLALEMQSLRRPVEKFLRSNYQVVALGGKLGPDDLDYLETWQILERHCRLGAQNGLLFFE